MALNTYKAFVDRMIGKYEGGYGWNRKDTGGPTKFGITCFDLAEHRGQKMSSMATWAPIVQAMTLAEAETIYQTKYANAIRYNDLPAGPDVEMLDYGVNSGITRPIRVVRAILGVPGGPVMDQKLLDAIRKADPAKLISDISAERLHFMHSIRNGSAWDEFGGGWGARVSDLKLYALHLLSAPGAVPEPQAPDLTKVSTPKAKHGSPDTVKNVIKTAGPATVTYGKGLWRVQGEDARLFTVADGLSNNQIRSLYQDPDGTLWIGTFGGGLDALRDGRFQAFTAKDGLLSDNIASLTDDGESLWLSTTRGICRIAKRQLREFAEHKRKILEPANYGVEDGLRSAQCSPSYPICGGGHPRPARGLSVT